MDIYGLIGNNISHSFSPDLFNNYFKKHKINAEYKLFDINDISQLPEIIESDKNIKGINVTIPFKKSVTKYIDNIDSIASLTGSVNVIKIIRNTDNVQLSGFNTDVFGFEKSLRSIIKTKKDIKALILGSGGAAYSVAYVLRRLGIFFYYVTRTPLKVTQIKYSSLIKADISEHKLIINTTPIGMWPDIDKCPPIPYEYLTKDHVLFDLIYNPEETLFLKKGKEIGATIINGRNMLEQQAIATWKIWKGKNIKL